MTFGTLGRVLPATLDEVDNLFAFDLVNDFGLNACIFNHRRAEHGAIAAQHQHFVKLDCFASIGRNTFNPQHIAGLYFVLLAACLDDRKHASSFSVIRVLWPPVGVVEWPSSQSASNSAPMGRH